MTAVVRSPVFAPFPALLLVTAATAAATPRFFDPGDLSNLALQVPIAAIGSDERGGRLFRNAGALMAHLF